MSEPLRDLMGELAGEQPLVADWPGRVHGLVVRRRRRRRMLTAAAAVALVALGGTGVLLAAEQPDRDALVAAPDPSPSPLATATASASATAPTPAPEPSASAQAVEPAEEEPAPSAAPPPPPPPPPSAPTYPPSGTQVIEITAQGRPERPRVGQEYLLDVTVTASADEPFLQQPCYDNEPCSRVAAACVPRDSSYSPPPPRPHTKKQTFRHTFTTPGRHEVLLEAESPCSYYRGYDRLVLVVQVDEPSPSAEPSPAPSPLPAP